MSKISANFNGVIKRKIEIQHIALDMSVEENRKVTIEEVINMAIDKFLDNKEEDESE